MRKEVRSGGLLLTRFLPALLLLAGCAARGAALVPEEPAPTAPLPMESPYLAPSALQEGQILHLATGRLLSESELITYLSSFPVVYVGETHDSLDDHAIELTVLKGLVERGPQRVALGLEMLQRNSQSEVDAYLSGRMDESGFARTWEKNWGDDTFRYYREILAFARDHEVPVRALNIGMDLREAARDGQTSRENRDLPDMDLEDPYHKAFIEAILGGHPMEESPNGSPHPSPHQGMEAFYRVQVLWDEAMAQSAARYLESLEGRGKQLLILAGGNHVSYGFGIPRRLFRRLPLPYSILLPFPVGVAIEKGHKVMEVELPEMPMRPADVFWAVGYESLD
ncbi:MAG: ChaN family lipoprotein [bacterium]